MLGSVKMESQDLSEWNSYYSEPTEVSPRERTLEGADACLGRRRTQGNVWGTVILFQFDVAYQVMFGLASQWSFHSGQGTA